MTVVEEGTVILTYGCNNIIGHLVFAGGNTLLFLKMLIVA